MAERGTDLTCTTGAPWSASECTVERLREIMAQAAKLKPKHNSVKMSRQTFAAFCAIYNIKTQYRGPETVPVRTIYGLELIFDEEMPLGKYELV